ncbi:MAG: LysE family translocator [Sphingomonadales bacterium]|nr:LysE family translocator [Sphingomonadales bacterium]
MIPHPYAQGFGFGLMLSVLIGPVFFALLQISITQGFRAGAQIAVGTLLSDMVLVGLCYFGLTGLIAIPENQRLLGILGGLFMLVYGGYLLLSRPPAASHEATNIPTLVTGPKGFLMVRGFLLNILNPFTLVYWLGLSTLVSALPTYEQADDLAFFGGTLSAVLFTDLLKSYLARRLRPWLSRARVLWLNRITGIVLMGFGISLLLQVFWLKRNFF